jgi:chromosome partitioning protein
MLYNQPMTHIIGVMSPKGGVGKSTITCGITAVISRYTTRRIMVLDSGGQQNTLPYLEGINKNGELLNVDYDYADDAGTITHLRELHSGHIYTLIDLPGYREATEQKAALEGVGGQPVVDQLVVPMGPSQFDMETVAPFVLDVLKPMGVPYGVVLSKVGPRGLAEAMELQSQLEASGIEVFRTIVRDYRGVRDAQAARKPITTFGGRHAEVRKAEDDIRALTREVLKRAGSRIMIPTRMDEATEEKARAQA